VLLKRVSALDPDTSRQGLRSDSEPGA
jgi:hypothetical protein